MIQPAGTGSIQAVSRLGTGQRIGRFRVEAFVAQGGMGEVYRCFDEQLQRTVALKTIRPDWSGEPVPLKRFQREAQILAKLNHPGICQVFDLIDHHGQMVLAMEWIEGRSLAETLALGLLPTRQVIVLAKAIAEALAAAHARGIIHRDLKPSNVMVTPEGVVKILDFGLAVSQGEDPRSESPTESVLTHAPEDWEAHSGSEPTSPVPAEASVGKLSQSGAVLGTYRYMAPEVLTGHRASSASDLFSFGVVLHELLTGFRPFPGEGAALARSVLSGRRSPMDHGIPAPLRRLVGALLRREPLRRPSAAQVLEVLQRFDRPASPAWWAAGAAALTLVAGGVAFWIHSRGVLQEFSLTRRARLVVAPIVSVPESPALALVASSTTDLLEQGLRRFPKVLVVKDQEPDRPRPRLEGQGPEAERAFLDGVVARTGANLVLLGEVTPQPEGKGYLLRVRLIDRGHALRTELKVPTPPGDFDPHLAVPALLQELSRKLSPLGSPPELPAIPSDAALKAYGLGMAALTKKDLKQALPLLEAATEEAPQFIPAILNLAECLARMDDRRAPATYQWARAVARDAGDRESQVEALLELAWLNRQFGKPSTEQQQLEEARSLAIASQNPDLEAWVLNQMAVWHLDQSDPKRAKELLDRALAILPEAGNRRIRSTIINRLANIAQLEGEKQQARRLYESVRADASITGDLELQATAQYNLAILDINEGRVDEAERSLLKVLALRRENQHASGEALALWLLGFPPFMRGDFAHAAQRFEEARALAQAKQLRTTEGRALYRLGDVLRAQGRLEPAQLRFHQALVILQQEGKGTPNNQSEALAALAECTARLANPAEAERLVHQARDLARTDTPQIWRARAWIARQQRNPREALACLARAQDDPIPRDPEHQPEVRALLAAWKGGD